MKSTEEHVQDLCENFKCSNINRIKKFEAKERDNRAGGIFKEIMAENFS